MLALDDAVLFGSGNERIYFLLPIDSSLCVKGWIQLTSATDDFLKKTSFGVR